MDYSLKGASMRHDFFFIKNWPQNLQKKKECSEQQEEEVEG